PAEHGVADRDDGAAHLEPWDVLRCAGRRGIAARALREVRGVQRRVRLGDQDLVGRGNRIGRLLEPQLLAVEDDSPHRSTVRDGGRIVASMRIALAQLDCRLGEVEANSERVRETISTAHARGAELVVFPELQLSGYAIGAIAHDASCSAVAAAAPASEAAALIGFLERDGDRRYNSAVYAVEREPLHVHRKLFLVDYPPFEENRVFAEGTTMRAFDTPLGRMAVLICNDAWHPVLPAVAAYDGAQVLLVPSCSSTAVPEAEAYWRELTRFHARMPECSVGCV